MEELKPTDGVEHGDQEENVDPSIEVRPGEETSVIQGEKKEQIIPSITLLNETDEKTVDSTPDTNPLNAKARSDETESQTTVEQVPNEPAVGSGSEISSVETDSINAPSSTTDDPCTTVTEGKGTADPTIEKDTANNKATKELETPNSLNEQQKAPMDIGAVESSNQAMDVEEPATTVPVATVSIQEQVAEEQQLEKRAVQSIANNSLSMLSMYSGSSDSEAEQIEASNTVGPAKASSSSSSSDDSDVEVINDAPMAGNYRVRDEPLLVSDAETMDTNAASSEDEEDEIINGPIRTAGEILPHELPPIEELTITVPEMECKPIGRVDSIVAQIVLVQSVPGAELLNLDTVLFLERGKRALGKIFDVIGQVNQPIYCVLFNSNQEVVSKNITVGMDVYCAPKTEYTSFIILSELMRSKGSDASWIHDNELPAYLADHSDDEEERAARKNRKKSAANRPSTDSRGEGMQPQQQHFHPREQYNHHQQHPSTSRPPFQRPPPNNGREFYPRQPSGHSWHHNYNNPRYSHPPQFQQRFPQRHQQYQRMPHSQAPPQRGGFLPNPFAVHPPPQPPPSGPQ